MTASLEIHDTTFIEVDVDGIATDGHKYVICQRKHCRWTTVVCLNPEAVFAQLIARLANLSVSDRCFDSQTSELVSLRQVFR